MKTNESKSGGGALNPDENNTSDNTEERNEAEKNDIAQEKNKKSQKNAELESKFGDASSPDASRLRGDKTKR